MRPKIPDISHLQYLALGVLMTGERPGRAIRDTIAGFGVRRSRAAFYQFMARLERDGLVEGWYAQVEIGDQMVTERRYAITAVGQRAWAQTRSFFEAADAIAGRARESNA
jgi:DNA-binding PadR family transcriptional regulator